MGPRDSAGKKVSAPRIRITLTNNIVNRGVVTGKLPCEGGAIFLPASEPAMASIGTIIRKRPANMVMPSVMLYQFVFALSPAKAEPLLPAAELYA